MQHIRFGTSANNVSCVQLFECGRPERFEIWRMKAQYVFGTYETACEINHLEQYQEILGEFLSSLTSGIFYVIWLYSSHRKYGEKLGSIFWIFKHFGEVPIPCSPFTFAISDTA